MKLERIITISRPAFDYILNPTEERGSEYGRGSVEMRFILKGPECAISWGILTGWNLPETDEELEKKGYGRIDPMGTAVCSHSAKRNRDYYEEEPTDCDILEGGKCWGDCGFLAGSEFFKTLVREGEEALWARMQAWYDDFSKDEE